MLPPSKISVAEDSRGRVRLSSARRGCGSREADAWCARENRRAYRYVARDWGLRLRPNAKFTEIERDRARENPQSERDQYHHSPQRPGQGDGLQVG